MDESQRRRFAVILSHRSVMSSEQAPAWTRATLATWNVPWPAPKGWRNALTRLSHGWFSLHGIDRSLGCIELRDQPLLDRSTLVKPVKGPPPVPRWKQHRVALPVLSDVQERRRLAIDRMASTPSPTARPNRGGPWKGAVLARWNVPSSAPKGWKKALIDLDHEWFKRHGIDRSKPCIDLARSDDDASSD